VRPFTEEVLFSSAADRTAELTAGEVSGFLASRLSGMSRKSAQMTACALRSLLRFLHAEQIIASPMDGVVLPVASWRLSGLPSALSADQLRALRGACDISGLAGRRDLAVITMMARLGLRCAEAAGLLLDDIDWATGTVLIRGKGGRTDRMPLPADAGQVLADYLQARPATSSREVFLRVRAPHRPLVRTSISCIVARAARRAGLGTVHGHRLRHTMATQTVNAGATLEEVAQLMRHEGVATTVIYAKTDRARLSRLARPWPAEGGGR
jgi:integrase/recombinase XerD